MMKINRPSEKQVIHQALDILSNNLDPSSFARFVAVCQLGEGDYLKTKEQVFNRETVDSLYEKIQAFETAKNELNP
ncbi:hypothetical protein NG799_29180 [Laspinema sp. D1]|uniref:Uncharacterized protein n=1 Tax=Laspinema palackyanum D2a TaxID=2953684 RepID=A0ABT2N064_9CYAN|nr:hypothetical protein [Laspinema sp. D2a]